MSVGVQLVYFGDEFEEQIFPVLRYIPKQDPARSAMLPKVVESQPSQLFSICECGGILHWHSRAANDGSSVCDNVE